MVRYSSVVPLLLLPLLPLVTAQAPAAPTATPAAPAPAAGGAPECFPASDSSVCGAFAGQSIDLRNARDNAGPRWHWNLTSATSMGALDSAILALMLPITTGVKAQDDMYSFFGCPNWDGTGWRYKLSALCGYLVTTSTNCPGNTGKGLMCPELWAQSVASGAKQFANTTVCPTAQQSTIGVLMQYMSGQIPAAAGSPCVSAEQEWNNCGFGVTPAQAALAVSYCAGNRNDTCCADLGIATPDLKAKHPGLVSAAAAGAAGAAAAAAASATPSTAPLPSSTAAPSASSSAESATSIKTTSDSHTSTGMIAAIAGGGVVVLLIAIATGVYCTRRRRREHELWQAHAKLQQAQSPTFGDMRNSPSRQESASPRGYSGSPGFASPAPMYIGGDHKYGGGGSGSGGGGSGYGGSQVGGYGNGSPNGAGYSSGGGGGYNHNSQYHDRSYAERGSYGEARSSTTPTIRHSPHGGY
ncbi:hypothetical protein BDZ88DRAFT_505459 [Geranomyces variabilis]|nr:hypothetical protein BDZ88DRAFT_505459 [Geranomyces variabilis]KAJ3136649.1 hypothetical protein HDU90_003025 [Geranomyces variabilis]